MARRVGETSAHAGKVTAKTPTISTPTISTRTISIPTSTASVSPPSGFRAPGVTQVSRGAGAVVTPSQQKPQTDVFGNVKPAYTPPPTIQGSRGQIRYADPSIQSGLSKNPFSEVGQVVYQTVQDVVAPVVEVVEDIFDPLFIPESQQVTTQQTDVVTAPVVTTTTPTVGTVSQIQCPARVKIISNITNVPAGDGVFDCDTIEYYENHPDYRVEYVGEGYEDIPEEEFVAPILQCADVYRWDNGVVVDSGQFTLEQLQGFIQQALMIRECNTTPPTEQEVKDHYGIVETADVEPPIDEEIDQTTVDVLPSDTVTPTVETDVVTAPIVTPDDVTTSQYSNWQIPSFDTNYGQAGLLFALALGIPFLAGVFKK